MDEKLFRDLLDQYLTGELTDGSRARLSQLLEVPAYRERLEAIMAEESRQHRFDEGGYETVIRRIEAEVLAGIDRSPRTLRIYRKWWVYAAAALLLATAGTYLVVNKPERQHMPAVVAGAERIPPGGNKAVLTLGDGKRIDLGATADGEVAMQGETKIMKADSGRLTYTEGEGKGGAVTMNTLTTPRGGIFQVGLPDGTQVWLNAGSSITYPTAFTGARRQVSIKGEAYFEVANDETRPFEVTVNDTRIEVLGTHFNVNAYENEENMKTTLLEGSIELFNGAYRTLLKPGLQAQSGKDDKITVLLPEDLSQTIAWKNGFFDFTNADLPMVMRQLERWYDIDVRYEGAIPQRRFQGELPRNLRLDEILNVLKGINIKYEIQGKILTIEG